MRPALFASAVAAALVGACAGLKAAQTDQAPPSSHWQPTYDPEHKHRLINTHGPWSDGRIQLPPPTDKFVLVVPRLKLLFCFIPKVGCTQFNRLMNELNGMTHRLGENCGNHDPIFASSVRYGKTIGNRWKWEMMQQQAWTKAVFLRDPLERLVSAHRSKCENDECGGCLESNFSKGVMEELLVNDNMHYLPQHHFCGNPHTNETLGTMLQHYHFVGHLTEDRAKTSKQVASMLHLALKRKESFADDAGLVDFAAAGGDVTLDGGSSVSEFTKESLERLARKHFLDGDPDSERLSDAGPPADAETMDSMVENYFPISSDLTDYEMDHSTGVNRRITSHYFNKDTLEVALEYYAKDYRTLPGLEVPAWVEHKLECVRITTGQGADDAGRLSVTVEVAGPGGPVSVQAADGFFAAGSTVLDKCFGEVLSVRARSPEAPGSWLGSVEWSPDGRVNFGPMKCADCAAGNLTKTILVAGAVASRASAPEVQASCFGGAGCELLRERLPPPPPTEVPTPVPTSGYERALEKLQKATPLGYKQVGKNCNCGDTLSVYSWEKPTPDLCSQACEKTQGCAAFAVWTSAATFDGMCKLFGEPCEDTDGWQPVTTCVQPTTRSGPNVGFNRQAGPNPEGEVPKRPHARDNTEAETLSPEKLSTKKLAGYSRGGSNCNCGEVRAEWDTGKDTPEACAAECDSDPLCTSFSVFTSQAKLPGMCRLWILQCPDDNGWERDTQCSYPSRPQDPNVNYNKRGVRQPFARLPASAENSSSAAASAQAEATAAPATPRRRTWWR